VLAGRVLRSRGWAVATVLGLWAVGALAITGHRHLGADRQHDHPREGQTSDRLASGQVLVAGGESFIKHAGTPLSSAELYTP